MSRWRPIGAGRWGAPEMLDDTAHLLPGLLPGRYRGVEFDVPDTRTETGRRVAEHLFPGHDQAKYDDLGLLPEVVSVEGVILGDDYIARAKALRSAFQKPGPATLMHPWLGPMRVIVDVPPEITFSSRELRVARFFAYFKRLPGGTGAGPSVSTAAVVARTASALAEAALSLLRSPQELTISRVGASASARSARVFTSAVTAALEEIPRVRSGAGTRPVSAALETAAVATPEALGELVSSVAAGMRDAVPALTARNAVVGPAYSAPAAEQGLSALQGLDLSLSIAGRLTTAAADAPSAPDRAMILGAAGATLSEVGVMLAQAEFPTRREATQARSAIAAASDALAEATAELSGSLFVGAATVMTRAVSDLRAATIADINEIIGRLPEVVTVTTDRPADAFQVANHLFGDTPSAIEAGYADIVARNRPRHPAVLPVGTIEAVR